MRVWFRKIHCPSFVCFFCKPPQHLCTPHHHHRPTSPFESDNSHRSPRASTAAVVVAADHLSADKKEEEELVGDFVRKVEDESETKPCSEVTLTSSIKRKAVSGVEEGRKKTVQWMDVAGKDLVDVREFETSESEETDSESEYNRGCICTML